MQKDKANDTFRQLMDLIPTHIVFRLGSGAEHYAEAFIGKLWDSKEVLDYRTKMVHDGYDEIRVLTHSTTKTEGGDKKKTVTETTRERARYREEKDAIYKTPQQKLAEVVRILSEMKIGEVMILSHDTATSTPVSTPLLRKPWTNSDLYVREWGMTVSEKRSRDIISRIRLRSQYSEPREVQAADPSPPRAATPLPSPTPVEERRETAQGRLARLAREESESGSASTP